MERKEFLRQVAYGLAGIAATSCMAGCSKDEDVNGNNNNNNNNNNNTGVDFTLDLTAAANAALLNVGGFIRKDNIIIARIDTSEYVAVAAQCTHQQTLVVWQQDNKRFHCPNHGSNFDKDGKVLNGPAGTNLKEYEVSLSGNNLRVMD